MRHGTTNRRQRSRGNGGARRGGQPRTQVYDSNGPDVRIRGTAHQVAEKYTALAKDAASAGDRILAESYLQHVEHYQRIINSWAAENVQSGRSSQGDQDKSAGHSQRRDSGRGNSSAKEKDDLSLPASILGESPKAKDSEKTNKEETEVTTV